MTALPKVTIVATTYFPSGPAGEARGVIAREVFASWRRNLEYDGPVALHVADDGTDGVSDWPEAAAVPPLPPFVQRWPVTTSRQERHGVGASLNTGFDVAHRDGGIALYLVDDWELLQRFDITPWVKVLMDDDWRNGGPVGMVRLGPPHPWLTGTIQTFPSAWGMRLDRHHFAFGHRPALYHPRMRETYGRFAEDVNAYDCERLYAEHWCATPGPDIVLALPEVWRHHDGPELADIEPRSGQ